jgi:HAD superfamily hydrolase (TIGR01662 family)
MLDHDFATKYSLGLGILRLGTEGRPETSEAVRLIHYALERGIRLLDTADSYCLSNDDFHYGEELVRWAIGSWVGESSSVRVMTKVGLVRPQGKWLPNGSPKHLRQSVDKSLVALGVEQIYLLQLHAKDPRVPWEDTITTLADLQKEGKVAHIGLCNVGPAEVRSASKFFPVASLQCELSVQSQASATNGMVALASQLGIPFFAYRPLGGYAKVSKLTGNRVLKPIAERIKTTSQNVALAALRLAGSHVIPLIGATRRESIDASLSALTMEFSKTDSDAIQAKYSFAPDIDALSSIRPQAIPDHIPKLNENVGPSDTAEVVIVMGIQGAGKSQLVQSYVDHGYDRLNRDELGGKLEDLNDRLAAMLVEGKKRIVLDNTYPTRVSRAGVVRVAHQAGVPVRCRWLNTPVGEARKNVVHRILDRYERLLGPEDMKQLAKEDPNLPPPAAMQKFESLLEPPDSEEGFSAIDIIPFQRVVDPNQQGKGLLLDVDGTLRVTKSGEIYPRSADDVELLPGRREVLQRWLDDGYQLFFVSNQSGIASGKLTWDDAKSAMDRTAELLQLPITEIVFCPHPAFPVGCFCRKPMPGIGVYLARKYRLRYESIIMVGDMDSDRAFAAGLGIEYRDATEFFQDGLGPT